MDLAQLPIIAASIVSVAGAGVSLWQAAQGARRVQAENDKTAVDGFDTLCERLEKRIDANDREITALRDELAKLRAENETLRTRIRDLEIENAQLKAQLDELQVKRARKGQRE